MKPINYGGLDPNSLPRDKGNRRIGIAEMAKELRRLNPDLLNEDITKFLNMDRRNLYQIIGISPRKPKPCKFCGKPIKADRSSRSKLIGACKTCRHEIIARKSKEPNVKLLCAECGGIFIRPWIKHKHNNLLRGTKKHFCGTECNQKWFIRWRRSLKKEAS